MAESSIAEIFERAWRERWPGWRAYALRLTRNPADADDVVLEATKRTLEAQPDLDTDARLHAYVLTAIRHISFDVVKRRRREVLFDEEREESPRQFASSALQMMLSGESRREQKALGVALHQELERLPKVQREAIELLVLRTPPLKLREVAELQGVTTSTVHYRLSRGLEVLATRARHSTAP